MTTKGRQRATAAVLVRRHGAWLIGLSEIDANMGSATPDELYDCAAAITTAKQVAVKMAKEHGWTGQVRWKHTPLVWELEMTDPGYEVDDDA